MLNPDDAMAVSEALRIKEEMSGTKITVVHLGPPAHERFIRDALAFGCDEGLRIWDEELEDIHAGGKCLILARVAEIVEFDILFTGTKSLDTGSSQLGLLLASSLKVPCITRVVGIDTIQSGTVTATRKLERGYRERVESATPLVVSVEADEEETLSATFSGIALASGKSIPCFDLSRIGIPLQAILQQESRLKFGPLQLPEPKRRFVQPPDSSLPAFDRRGQLGEGSYGKRRGRIVRGDEDSVVEELFQALQSRGFLDHLIKESKKPE